MMQLTRRYHFSASHRLHSNALPDEENRKLYGKCDNPFGHGHNYEVEVTVAGPVDEKTGRVMDLGVLDGLVRREVLEPFDHRNLNEEIVDFTGIVPTTENLCAVIDRRLRRVWMDGLPRLERVRIYETARNIFET